MHYTVSSVRGREMLILLVFLSPIAERLSQNTKILQNIQQRLIEKTYVNSFINTFKYTHSCIHTYKLTCLNTNSCVQTDKHARKFMKYLLKFMKKGWKIIQICKETLLEYQDFVTSIYNWFFINPLHTIDPSWILSEGIELYTMYSRDHLCQQSKSS